MYTETKAPDMDKTDDFGDYLLKRGLQRNIILLLVLLPVTIWMFLTNVGTQEQSTIGLPAVGVGAIIVIGIGYIYTRQMVSALKDDGTYEENKNKLKLFLGTYALMCLCFIVSLLLVAF